MNNKAFVVSAHFGTVGGGVRAPYLLARELENMGKQVTVFAGVTVFGDDRALGNFTVHTPLMNKGWNYGIPIWVLSRQVIRAVKKQQPGLVIMCGLTGLARHLLKSSIASELTVWEFTNATPDNPFVDPEAARMISRCKRMLSPSFAIDEKIRQTYAYNGSIQRLPFWVEERSFDLENGPEKVYDFIYLGRLHQDKGLNELISATAEIQSSHEDIRLLVVGPGDPSIFQKQVAELGIGNYVTFKFFPAEVDVEEAVQQSKFLVLPSYHEGYPLVLLEAARFGVPFIATEVGSIPEMTLSSKAGLLIKPRDVRALRLAMIQVLLEPVNEYQSRSLAARELFCRLSGPNNVRDRLAKIDTSSIAPP
ncbi:glycosyltransferase family 4 protein [Pseudomonadota bacterium]